MLCLDAARMCVSVSLSDGSFFPLCRVCGIHKHRHGATHQIAETTKTEARPFPKKDNFNSNDDQVPPLWSSGQSS
jgi:hypothetical protein